ncbi:MAG: GspE/PulE family protein [Candidatus Margulisiibacteriota bacterium]|jgi:type IV pilus assembly protein PilB
MTNSFRKNLGLEEALLEAKLINPSQLEDAKLKGLERNERFLVPLMELGFVDDHELAVFLGEYTGYQVISMNQKKYDQTAIKAIPSEVARKYTVIPLFKVFGILTIAMVDPLNMYAVEELEYHSGCKLQPVIAPLSEINTILDQQYGVYSSIKKIVESLGAEGIEGVAIGQVGGDRVFQVTASAGPVNQILHLIISHAVRERASDIHFEPTEKMLDVRFRVDGVLHSVLTFPRQFSQSLISSIKILAKMDIAEKRLPQDGGFQVKLEEKVVDLRISSFPIMEGEKIVIRLLDREGIQIGLEQLGLMEESFHRFMSIINQSYGIILVTGPTGSGKTTTLYSVLNKIKNSEKNIMTIEDPIEYQLDMVNQAQVNVKAGLTFAKGLRHFLRQDPDIILVGEIRDAETAEIAFQAAMTGHLVLATLHTNDAPSSITRLIEMNVEPFLISSSIVGVLAQRLVRLNCPRCQAHYVPDTESLRWANLLEEANDGKAEHRDKKGMLVRSYSEEINKEYIGIQNRSLKSMEFIKGKGCKECKGTGYQGRMGIYELMLSSDSIKNMIMAKGISSTQVREIARQEGMVTLKEDGIRKALQGLTTLEEVIRVAK